MPARYLSAGDCFVISRTPFILSSAEDAQALNAADVFSGSETFAALGAGNEVEILTGSVSLASPGVVDLLDLLPPAIIIHAESISASSFSWLLDELDREWQSRQVGAQTMCNDLLRLVFIHALRLHITSAEVADLNWLSGLQDPAIAAVLRSIHSAPEKPWRLDELANVACMSRSSFAALFKKRVGQAPVEYATRWRMQVAGARLRNGIDSVATVAASLGYLSDAAFGAAFRRIHGKTPGQYRREALS
ncbi:helix-turn-helix transcriptional regulator [Pseudomonas reactans]|uniref:Helix-turn-helix transcriptional regulator n=2 Tax=Pseudomonas reactans TaxID=117680 RepID=A0ABX2QYN4_9PSED|nr:helix-turn-helix transcriptional regulator [Pseudomonas reactans]NWD96465.1 helix-turn-helix transcriptional regulator [Pseudomonas reactans]